MSFKQTEFRLNLIVSYLKGIILDFPSFFFFAFLDRFCPLTDPLYDINFCKMSEIFILTKEKN
jgi:hypothetical protein